MQQQQQQQPYTLELCLTKVTIDTMNAAASAQAVYVPRIVDIYEGRHSNANRRHGNHGNMSNRDSIGLSIFSTLHCNEDSLEDIVTNTQTHAQAVADSVSSGKAKSNAAAAAANNGSPHITVSSSRQQAISSQSLAKSSAVASTRSGDNFDATDELTLSRRGSRSYHVPTELSLDPNTMMQSMMNGRYSAIDTSSTVAMMKNGKIFSMYLPVQSDTTPSNVSFVRQNWWCQYQEFEGGMGQLCFNDCDQSK